MLELEAALEDARVRMNMDPPPPLNMDPGVHIP